MTLKVISAEQILFDGQVSLVTLPGSPDFSPCLKTMPPLCRR